MFRGLERLKQPGEPFRADAGATVADLDLDRTADFKLSRADADRSLALGPRQPSPARAKMQPGEPDDGHKQHSQQHMRPPHHSAIFIDRLRVHQQELAQGKCRRPDSAE
jgi:hypothetical protein